MRALLLLAATAPLRICAISLAQQSKVTVSQRSKSTAKVKRQLSEPEKVQSDGVAVLSSLLKSFQLEQERDAHAFNKFQHWCTDANNHREALTEVFQRRLGDINTTIKQTNFDQQRLENELRLVQANIEEKKHQLNEAVEAEQVALTELADDSAQADQALVATHQALHLVPRSSRAATGNSTQNGTDTQTMLNTLDGAAERLSMDRGAANKERREIMQKSTRFTARLNSSITESESQAAAMQMEIAQRKRNNIRLSGQVVDLALLLKSISDSEGAAVKACMQGKKQRKQDERYLSMEADAVTTVLEKISPDNAMLFLQKPDAPLLLELRHSLLRSKATTDPLSEIRQFAESADGQSDKVGKDASDLPGSRSAKHQNSSLELEQITERLTWCEVTMRDAKRDNAAAKESLGKLNAQIKLVNSAILDGEHSSAFYAEQGKAINQQLGSLENLLSEENQQNAHQQSVLGDFSSQLQSVVTEFNSETTPGADQSAEQVMSLSQRLLSHQTRLVVKQRMWTQWSDDIVAAAAIVKAALQASAQHDALRISQLHTDLQFLKILQHSRATNQDLTGEYKTTAGNACSHEYLEQLRRDAAMLKKQTDEF